MYTEKWRLCTTTSKCNYLDISPFGVHATRNLTVLCCLYWLHVDDCMKRSDGVSIKISLPSIMAYVVANFSLKTDGNVAFTCSIDGIQSTSMKT